MVQESAANVMNSKTLGPGVAAESEPVVCVCDEIKALNIVTQI